MHELSVAKNIVRIAREHLTPQEESQLIRIRVRIGEFSTIVPELLQSGFKAAVDGTAMEQATLDVTVVPLSVQCHTCGEIAEIEPIDFSCPLCTSNDVNINEGNEIIIDSLEISEPTNHYES